jgi:XTP/dITP diphosphohydrolase
MRIMEILLATQNKGKLKEMEELLKADGVNFIALAENTIEEPEEDGDSFEDNAIIKAEFYSKRTEKACISDDSGLVIPKLNGDPGIFSSRWAGEGKNFNVAMDRVYNNLLQRGVDLKFDEVEAFFYCAMAYKVPGSRTEVFFGKVEGHLTYPARGDDGFGYDPIFVPKGSIKTFAEMGSVLKNKDNHRVRAAIRIKSHIRRCNYATISV